LRPFGTGIAERDPDASYVAGAIDSWVGLLKRSLTLPQNRAGALEAGAADRLGWRPR